MKIRPILSIIVLFSFIAIGCKSEKETPATESLKVPDSISLKGLSLGMDFSIAREQALKLFEDAGFSKEIMTEIKPDSTEFSVLKMPLEPIWIGIWKDEKGKLFRVQMSTYATETFFNAKDLSAEEFVKEFAKNYKLPNMKPNKNEPWVTWWNYESKNNWRISINDAKYIKYETIPEKQKP